MKNLFKYISGILIVLAVRLIPHPPNIEPVTSTLMPYSKKWGILGGILFSLLAVGVYDLLTGTIGVWSLMTAGSFALIGLLSAIYFKNRGKLKHYVGFSVIATLLFDAITGVGTGVLFFGQGLMQTVMMQIPFTAMHLAGNVVLAAVLSPVVYRWIVDNPKMETSSVLHLFKSLLKS